MTKSMPSPSHKHKLELHHPQRKGKISAQTITIGGVFAVLALVFSYIEFLFPISLGVPGVKLGLANLVIVIALYQMGFRWAALINFLRILLAGLLFTGLFAMLYSLAGAAVSLSLMGLLHKTEKFSIIGVSIAGAVAHNFGQLLIAALLVETAQMFLYFPVLLFSGLVSGTAIGIVALILSKKLKKTVFK